MYVKHTMPYYNCIYNRLPEDEPSGSKHVGDITIKILHYVQRYRSPSTYPPQQHDTICSKYLSLTLLMMGKILPETCWADLIDQ